MSTPSSRLSPPRCSVSGTTVTDLEAASCDGMSAVESVTMATRPLLKPGNDSPGADQAQTSGGGGGSVYLRCLCLKKRRSTGLIATRTTITMKVVKAAMA